MSRLWAWVETLEGAGPIVLPADEARHVAARRLRVGDPIVVFDGCGGTAGAEIEAISKKTVRAVASEVTRAPRPDTGFVLASAIPKGDRLSTMLQMFSQLGLETWQPLVLEDSAVRRLDADSARLHRILVESAKVARRPWLLEVRPTVSLERALAERPKHARVYFGEREGAAGGLEAPGEGDPGAVARLVLIGPEAGFSERERALLAAAEAAPRRFAPHNLRIETAAVAAVVAANLAASGATSASVREGEGLR
jgi:16S rRNA (uracil1498-N3)-methyltransferase